MNIPIIGQDSRGLQAAFKRGAAMIGQQVFTGILKGADGVARSTDDNIGKTVAEAEGLGAVYATEYLINIAEELKGEEGEDSEDPEVK